MQARQHHLRLVSAQASSEEKAGVGVVNLTGTLTAVRVGYGDSHVVIETEAGPAELQCWRAQAVEAEPLLERRVRVEVEWLAGGFFGLTEMRRAERCVSCASPSGDGCEDCGARARRN